MTLAASTDAASVLLELGGAILLIGLLTGISRRLGLPATPLFLLVGLFLGHGSVADFGSAEPSLSAAATLGAVLLLFFLGLEYSGPELVAGLRAHRMSGVLDLVANATPGFLIGLAAGFTPVESLLLAGITYVSSSGIVARALDELGRLGNRETPTILSILVFEDLAMAVYLPVVAGLVAGGTVLVMGVRVAIALAGVAVALTIAIRFGPRISRLGERAQPDTVLFAVLGAVLVVAGLAEHASVSAGVGAFLVGVAVSGRVARVTADAITPLRDFFAGMFFLFFGIQTDPADLPPVLGLAAVLVVVTVVTKFASAYWAARQAGIGLPGRVRAATVLGARGEFSIVLAGLAVVGDLDPQIGALAAAYVLGTAAVSAVATKFADNATHRWLQRRPREVQ